jgi:hypothetical protein
MAQEIRGRTPLCMQPYHLTSMLQPNASASTTAQVVKNAPEGVTVQGRTSLLKPHPCSSRVQRRASCFFMKKLKIRNGIAGF